MKSLCSTSLRFYSTKLRCPPTSRNCTGKFANISPLGRCNCKFYTSLLVGSPVQAATPSLCKTEFNMGLTDVVGLIHLTTVLSILIFCTQNMDWSAVTLDAVGNSRLSAISPLMLGIMRTICGLIVWGTLLFITLTGKPLFLMVLLRDGNKRLVSLLGAQRCAMYTVWSWTIQVRTGVCCLA
jgi:hypothetical protein